MNIISKIQQNKNLENFSSYKFSYLIFNPVQSFYDLIHLVSSVVIK